MAVGKIIHLYDDLSLLVFSRYLWDIHGSNGSTGEKRSVYGAVVVGKRMVFYKYFYEVLNIADCSCPVVT